MLKEIFHKNCEGIAIHLHYMEHLFVVHSGLCASIYLSSETLEGRQLFNSLYNEETEQRSY